LIISVEKEEGGKKLATTVSLSYQFPMKTPYQPRLTKLIY